MNDGQGNERMGSAELREVTFPHARRGYDREAVHAFLDRIADWVDIKAGDAADASPQLRNEFAKVGERTAGILTAAEEAAAKQRREAKEYAEKLRSSVEGETRQAKLNASQKADELIAEAESKAGRIIDEAVTRRRRLNQAVSSLVQRRDEIAEEAQQLADQLLEAVDAFRSDETIDEVDDDFEDEPADDADFEEGELDAEAERSRLTGAGFSPGTPAQRAEPTELEPPDQRETTVHDSASARPAPRPQTPRGDLP